MAKKFYYPPAPGNGKGTFSDNLVGMQITEGSPQMTLGNFSISDSSSSKQEISFDLGGFSGPITLEQLDAGDTNLSRQALNYSLLVDFNYDYSDISNLVLYGSLKERLRVAAQQIVNFFPGALCCNGVNNIYHTTGNTAESITYDPIYDRTTIVVSRFNISNPFDIEITTDGDIGVEGSLQTNYLIDDPTTDTLSTVSVKAQTGKISPLRNFSLEYRKYALSFSGSGDTEYTIIDYTPIDDTTTGLTITVSGSPFGDTATTSTTEFYLKPNKQQTQTQFDNFEHVEKFLLNQNSVPQYKAEIALPRQTEGGQNFTLKEEIIWYKQDLWNIDVTTEKYTDYLKRLVDLGEELDDYKTNLVSRFLTTGALKDFDSGERKVEKTLQIYGRSFDNIKKFIDGIAYMNNITYDAKNNVPNQLLRNFAKMLGWKTPSTISQERFLDTILDRYQPQYSGESVGITPAELDIEIYRRILMNTSYLFKSKGTRKAIEFLFRFIGAPEALIEFNEYVVLADNWINIGCRNKIKDNDVCHKLFALLNSGTSPTKPPKQCPQGTFWDPSVESCVTKEPSGNGTGGPTPTETEDSDIELQNALIDKENKILKKLNQANTTNTSTNATQEIQELLVELGCYCNDEGFYSDFQNISGGVVTTKQYVFDPSYGVYGQTILSSSTFTHNFVRDDYPIDEQGYPKAPRETPNYYFQRGAGWFEETEEHHGDMMVDLEKSVFSGCNPNVVTKFNQFSWGGFFGNLPPDVNSNDPGAPYLERFRKFPYMKWGFNLTPVVDDKKSWIKIDRRNEDREYRFEGIRYASYHTHDERYVINVKNVDAFLNVGQALSYDFWQQSVLSGCPFSGGPLPLPYPQKGGVDETVTLINGKDYSFKKFTNKFWRTFINVKNRQTIDDGKTGGYPLLQLLYLDYLAQSCGENHKYTYQKMVDYAQSLGTYWIRLIEQLVPATTLWQGGLKVENSVFHRDKFTYKHYPTFPLPGFWKSGDIVGCTDPSANNYNPLANVDDGSCLYNKDDFGGGTVGVTDPRTGSTCSNGCQNTGSTVNIIDGTDENGVKIVVPTTPCPCCNLPEDSMVLKMRPFSATCKSVWPSFLNHNGVLADTSNTGVNNSINLITEKFASNDSTINGAYNIISTMNNDIMFRIKRTIPLSKNKTEPWGYTFRLENGRQTNNEVNINVD
tara:strand:+ start:23223 stop:26759 length:3537 start_codon:yes stop_codon:yes gene_type:complete